jgi:hypothetical protein
MRHPAVFGPTDRTFGVDNVQRKVGCLPRGDFLMEQFGSMERIVQRAHKHLETSKSTFLLRKSTLRTKGL